ELHPRRWLRLRVGKFKSPVGLEWLQSDSNIVLLERSLASDLVPQRDLGVMLAGDIADETFPYALGIFNGATDGANGPDLDLQSSKDYVGRLFLRPLRRIARTANWVDLGLGIAASYGTAAANNLPIYKSTGQQSIFTYITTNAAADTVSTAGDRWRVSPQAYAYIGPVGVLAEYVISSQHAERLGMAADLQNQAWNVTASFVLTLDRASYDGVVPRHPLDFHQRNFGP